MKIFPFLLCFIVILGCNKEKDIETRENCSVTYKPVSTKVIINQGRTLYYTFLYGGGTGVRYDYLKIIVSDFDVSSSLTVDKTLDYRKEASEKLVRCLRDNNKNSYVQDLWFDMKEQLDPEDDSKWYIDKDGRNQLMEGFYPQVITIENPILKTFKIDSKGAEIKSHLYSNHADTLETLIEWNFENGRYVFKKYTTTAIDDYDPAVD